MSCLSCGSNHQEQLAAEMIIHFSGLRNVDKAGVWVFPHLLVCLDCGFSSFSIPETELPILASGAPENLRSVQTNQKWQDDTPRFCKYF